MSRLRSPAKPKLTRRAAIQMTQPIVDAAKAARHDHIMKKDDGRAGRSQSGHRELL
jgi:hypothetical protein